MSNFSAVVSQKMEQAKDVAGNIHVPGRINKAKCFTLVPRLLNLFSVNDAPDKQGQEPTHGLG